MKRLAPILLFLFGCSSQQTPPPAPPVIVSPAPEVKNGTGPLIRLGQDPLALLHPRFNGTAFTRYLRAGKTGTKRAQIGILDYTFGVDTKNLETVLASGKVARVRVHLINAVCARNRRCQKEDGVAWRLDSKALDKAIREGKADKQIRSRTAVYRGLSERFGVEFFISPLLEHDQSQTAWVHAAGVVREVWPGVQLVNNPHSGYSGRPMGALLERHGNTPSGNQVSSLDGKSLFDLGDSGRNSWRKRTANEKFTLSWIKEANCLPSGSWVPPVSRKNCPNGKMFKRWSDQTVN